MTTHCSLGQHPKFDLFLLVCRQCNTLNESDPTCVHFCISSSRTQCERYVLQFYHPTQDHIDGRLGDQEFGSMSSTYMNLAFSIYQRLFCHLRTQFLLGWVAMTLTFGCMIELPSSCSQQIPGEAIVPTQTDPAQSREDPQCSYHRNSNELPVLLRDSRNQKCQPNWVTPGLLKFWPWSNA